jgi:ATP-dependent RNA helicase DDX54/DBP10
VLLIGGDSLEDQFGMMASNPDIIIATPVQNLGQLCGETHFEQSVGFIEDNILDAGEIHVHLSSIKYVVFDEADRLFEMGFAAQLTEILHGLPRRDLIFRIQTNKTWLLQTSACEFDK